MLWLGLDRQRRALFARTMVIAAACACAAATALAQSGHDIQISAGLLEHALADLQARSGLRIDYRADAVRGRRTGGYDGTLDGPAALAKLLRGTGLVYFMRGERVAVVEDIVRVQATGRDDLEEILVEGEGAGGRAGVGPRGPVNATGYGPADGFVASRSLTATKTDTPLIETPQAISIVTADQIKAQGAQNLASALRYNASVTGEPFGPDPRGSFLQLRGFSVSDEIFFRDGLRLSGSDFASFMRLEPYGAERLEILRGPSSVLYGQSAPAGILNYVSKRPTDVAFGEISASLGSFDRYQGEFDFGGPVPGTDGVWSYRLTGLARDGETQVHHFYDDRVFIAPAVTWKPNEDTTLTILGNYQKDHNGYATQFLPALGSLYRKNGRYISDRLLTGEPGDHDDQEQAAIGYLLEHKVGDAVTLRQNVRYDWLDNEQVGAYGVGAYRRNPPGNDLRKRIADFGESTFHSFAIDNQAQVKFDTAGVAHTFLAGVDYRYGRFEDKGGEARIAPIDVFDPVYGARRGPYELYQDTLITQKQTGLYAQDQIKLGRWSLVLGGRFDSAATETSDYLRKPDRRRSAQQDDAFTGRAGLVYLFDSGLAPYVSYSESFFPTIGQNRTTGKAFEPETGRQYEAGVKFQPPDWNAMLTAAVFDLKKDNVLLTRGISSVQAGSVRSRGLELEGVASLKTGWNASVSYSYVDAEFLTTDDFSRKGDTPATIPTQRFSAWSDYTLQTGALAGVGFGGGVRVVGRSWGDDGNTFRVPAYTLFDAMVSYTRDSWKFQVNGTNLADKRHVAGCFDATQCFYGESRRVIAKATYSW